MTRAAKAGNQRTVLIEDALGQNFAAVKAKVYGRGGSIRVRVIDPTFAGLSRVERERLVRPQVHLLPKDVQSDITVLLLLAPGEERTSLMNLEFEQPSGPTL